MRKRKLENNWREFKIEMPEATRYLGMIIEKSTVLSKCIGIEEGKLIWSCRHKPSGRAISWKTEIGFKLADLPSGSFYFK